MNASRRGFGAGRPSRRTFEVLSLGTFIALGVPDGMLGTAWPSMRQSFRAPIGDLGVILLVATAGSVAVSLFVGALIRHLRVAGLLVVAASCAALGAVGFALAPGLPLLLGGTVLLGVAAGMMDGGLNTAIGLQGRRRLLQLLHGSYGLGTAVGPLLVTAAVVLGSWRIAYLALVAFDLSIAILWLVHRRRATVLDATSPPPAIPETVAAHSSEGWSRRRSVSVVVVGIGVFFVYTGLEVSAGQWEASYCRGHLGLSATAAGIATFGYWGALTAVRFALALSPWVVPATVVVGWGSGLTVFGAGAIWWAPGTAVALVGFVLLGAALAGVFPALIALTPVRIGGRRSQHVIAWQVGAAAAGGSAIAALVGLFVGATSLAVIGPVFTVLAGLLIAGNILLGRIAPIADEPLPSE